MDEQQAERGPGQQEGRPLAVVNGTASKARTNWACDSCRALKIRCINSGQQGKVPCENCMKTSRQCNFVPRVRARRRRRADARVTELEGRFEVLSALVEQGFGQELIKTAQLEELGNDLSAQDDFDSFAINLGRTHEGSNPFYMSLDQTSHEISSWPVDELATFNSTQEVSPARTNSKQMRHRTAPPLPQTTLSQTEDAAAPPLASQEDVITQGIVSWEVASNLFKRYRSQLTHSYPIVPVAHMSDALQFQRENPILFLAMITAAAAVAPDEIRDLLHEETLRIYARRIMIEGKKSLELLQAMLVTVAWYRPCGTYNDTKYQMFTQLASLMAQELGLGNHPDKNPPPWSTETQYVTTDPQLDRMEYEETSLRHTRFKEMHRTLVAAYIQSSNKYLLSHVSTLPTQSSHLAFSFEVLESLDDDLKSDRDLATMGKILALTEDARRSLDSVTISTTKGRLAEGHVPLVLTALATRLSSLIANRTMTELPLFLMVTYHACIIHLNEIMLHEDFDPRDFSPPYNTSTRVSSRLPELGPNYMFAIMRCVSSSQAILDSFLATDLKELSSLPSVMFVRMNYAIVILFKIYVLTTVPGHTIAAVLSSSYLRLDELLENLHRLLSGLAHSLSFHGAHRYLDIVERIQLSYAALQESIFANGSIVNA